MKLTEVLLGFALAILLRSVLVYIIRFLYEYKQTQRNVW